MHRSSDLTQVYFEYIYLFIYLFGKSAQPIIFIKRKTFDYYESSLLRTNTGKFPAIKEIPRSIVSNRINKFTIKRPSPLTPARPSMIRPKAKAEVPPLLRARNRPRSAFSISRGTPLGETGGRVCRFTYDERFRLFENPGLSFSVPAG